MDVLPPLLVFEGLAAGIVGCLGLAGRLPRNNVAGVRTPSTMRSETAFRVANKAAGVPTLTGGGVALAGAVAAWLLPTDEGVLTVVIVAAIGMLTLTILGGVMGCLCRQGRTRPGAGPAHWVRTGGMATTPGGALILASGDGCGAYSLR
ncbi:SdpI family protein [Nonomuraea sp. 10N515B]|uniref:SdpI family protein n=1 Tax=Nonomuraea sp. 10N515B TaxID=3457422 RepID=UPI003FCD124B